MEREGRHTESRTVEPHRYTDNDRFVAYWVIKSWKGEKAPVATIGQGILTAWALVYDVLLSLSASRVALETLVKMAEPVDSGRE